MPVSTISQAGLDAPISLTSPTLTTPNIDSAQIVTVSGTAPLYMCRAWVNFNGTGTVAIRASGNVTSITDNGLGDYTVNFTNAMPDANYSVSYTQFAQIATTWGFIGVNTFSTSSIKVASMNNAGNGQDLSSCCAVIFR